MDEPWELSERERSPSEEKEEWMEAERDVVSALVRVEVRKCSSTSPPAGSEKSVSFTTNLTPFFSKLSINLSLLSPALSANLRSSSA